ncbi:MULTISPECIES: N-acetylmuramoyl-L-alanine amidase [unclassified Exiguobacterium]|uniref:N-acetylmuramoyl-L-alanine amidase n=1 Tax=unclassified Exiguobacterium TaxID=2644629 RepID=UPI001BEAA6E5|nr:MULTISPECIES: N-acetylmuramoyl-L-alanine amidase [unclassified Exiguobacterium]
MSVLKVKSIDGVPVTVNIVPKGNIAVRPAYPMNPTSVAVHNTGNSGKGADAEAHNRLLHNQSKLGSAARWASYHFVVDAKGIYQNLPLNESAWHTGDGAGIFSGNRTAIGIEICENSDMDYEKAELNAVKLVAFLMDMFNFNISQIKPHQAYSGKYCPHKILSRSGGFTTFTTAVRDYRLGSKPVIKDTVKVPSPNVAGATSDRVNDSYSGLRLEVIYNGEVNFYSKPGFDTANRIGTVSKGLGFPTVVDKFKIDGSYMYEVRNSKGATYYITAREDLVRLVNSKGTTAVVSKPRNKTINGITVAGYVQVVNVRNACYIVASPSSRGKILGTAKKGEKLPISGSVTGWFEVIHDGKRAYINAKYGKRV